MQFLCKVLLVKQMVGASKCFLRSDSSCFFERFGVVTDLVPEISSWQEFYTADSCQSSICWNYIHKRLGLARPTRLRSQHWLKGNGTLHHQVEFCKFGYGLSWGFLVLVHHHRHTTPPPPQEEQASRSEENWRQGSKSGGSDSKHTRQVHPGVLRLPHTGYVKRLLSRFRMTTWNHLKQDSDYGGARPRILDKMVLPCILLQNRPLCQTSPHFLSCELNVSSQNWFKMDQNASNFWSRREFGHMRCEMFGKFVSFHFSPTDTIPSGPTFTKARAQLQ